MQQYSFLSADIHTPAIADLAGVLCAQGQIAHFGSSSARLSIVVDQKWRAEALVYECQLRNIAAAVSTSDSGHPLVRTEESLALAEFAKEWQRGAVKAVPPHFALTGPILRLWALASGQRTESGYLFTFDQRAPDTHSALLSRFPALGLRGTKLGPRGGGPGIRISGQRRLTLLADLMGTAPAAADHSWPTAAALPYAS